MYFAYLLNPETQKARCINSPKEAQKLRKEGWIDISENHFVMIDNLATLGKLTAMRDELLALAENVITCLEYPRGSEAQIRCLEEVGQDARALIKEA